MVPNQHYDAKRRKKELLQEQSDPPSLIFGRRLQERRRAAGWSQTELAEAMTREGFEMGKTAVLRTENGTRELKLDEAIAFAEVLNAPFAELLEPAADRMVRLTENRATDGDGITSWLTTGTPFAGAVWPAQMRTRQDRELAAEYLRNLAVRVVNAEVRVALAADAETKAAARKTKDEEWKAMRDAIRRAHTQAKEGIDA